VNLTITADRLSALPPGTTGPPEKSGSRPPAGWGLTHHDRGSPDDPDWCGTWTLTLPGGRELMVGIEPVPTHACDHRHESHAYQPNDALRHLVQVRDYTCTFPSCSRHARESDFEHAQPYDKGGRTCSCNAGARSRRYHRVKQSPGWKVNLADHPRQPPAITTQSDFPFSHGSLTGTAPARALRSGLPSSENVTRSFREHDRYCS
jgi:hypothetical protein